MIKGLGRSGEAGEKEVDERRETRGKRQVREDIERGGVARRGERAGK